MDILGNLRRLESRLTRSVDGAAQRITQATSREPLQVLHAIVDCVEKRVEPAGRGKYVFPFNRIAVQIAAGSRESRARFDAVFESKPSLADRISERLRLSGCGVTRLSIDVTYVDTPAGAWIAPDFHVEFDRISAPCTMANDLSLSVGAPHARNYVFSASRVNIGRYSEVRDVRNRLMKTNHVAIAADAVSRSHARIEWIDEPGEYRVYDDRSTYGTSVLRDGHTIPVPPGSRGIRLQTGDILVLGTVEIAVSLSLRWTPHT
jgi:hypothetical protein